ncbi:hypothetical protein SCHPADRAFT_412629 [Schizopora paradoxa]|uniref:Uncharacterized protein n=1 Tax=Schizopora paradoxa TaxID=27342 RepID=A0A0H2RSZ3_9AGAM|nr:hypothetical protein SCHPADRAFT_412629 [Schizopora paradoxa]
MCRCLSGCYHKSLPTRFSSAAVNVVVVFATGRGANCSEDGGGPGWRTWFHLVCSPNLKPPAFRSSTLGSSMSLFDVLLTPPLLILRCGIRGIINEMGRAFDISLILAHTTGAWIAPTTSLDGGTKHRTRTHSRPEDLHSTAIVIQTLNASHRPRGEAGFRSIREYPKFLRIFGLQPRLFKRRRTP